MIQGRGCPHLNTGINDYLQQQIYLQSKRQSGRKGFNEDNNNACKSFYRIVMDTLSPRPFAVPLYSACLVEPEVKQKLINFGAKYNEPSYSALKRQKDEWISSYYDPKISRGMDPDQCATVDRGWHIRRDEHSQACLQARHLLGMKANMRGLNRADIRTGFPDSESVILTPDDNWELCNKREDLICITPTKEFFPMIVDCQSEDPYCDNMLKHWQDLWSTGHSISLQVMNRINWEIDKAFGILYTGQYYHGVYNQVIYWTADKPPIVIKPDPTAQIIMDLKSNREEITSKSAFKKLYTEIQVTHKNAKERVNLARSEDPAVLPTESPAPSAVQLEAQPEVQSPAPSAVQLEAQPEVQSPAPSGLVDKVAPYILPGIIGGISGGLLEKRKRTYRHRCIRHNGTGIVIRSSIRNRSSACRSQGHTGA